MVYKCVSEIAKHNVGKVIKLESGEKFGLFVGSWEESVPIKAHEHYKTTQVMYVLDGYGMLLTGECTVRNGCCEKTKNGAIILEKGMLVIIPPHTAHLIEVIGEKTALEFLMFNVPSCGEGDFREICKSCGG